VSGDFCDLPAGCDLVCDLPAGCDIVVAKYVCLRHCLLAAMSDIIAARLPHNAQMTL
jgi:hypothetical protein